MTRCLLQRKRRNKIDLDDIDSLGNRGATCSLSVRKRPMMRALGARFWDWPLHLCENEMLRARKGPNAQRWEISEKSVGLRHRLNLFFISFLLIKLIAIGDYESERPEVHFA
jgi:hypothetical protein